MLANEALGLSYRETLDSSYALIEVMMQEYAYITRERNKALDKGEDNEGGEYEWVELPSFDNPNEMVRYKKYRDVGDKIKG